MKKRLFSIGLALILAVGNSGTAVWAEEVLLSDDLYEDAVSAAETEILVEDEMVEKEDISDGEIEILPYEEETLEEEVPEEEVLEEDISTEEAYEEISEDALEAEPAEAELTEDEELLIGESLTETEIDETIVVNLPEENDELLEEYLDEQLMQTGAAESSPSKYRLTGRSALLFSLLRTKIENVASGQLFSTEFTFSLEDLQLDGVKWTAEDLGVSSIFTEDYQVPGTVVEAVKRKAGLDISSLSLIGTALCRDCPYELYWFDKTWGIQMNTKFQVGYDYNKSEYVIYLTEGVTFGFPVAAEYASDTFMIDSDVTGSIAGSVDNALAIADRHSGEDDLTKLNSFREEICELVDYNFNAAGDVSIAYGNPWQLIWVFDDDPSTKVVCEGYSKAFQYLCNLSTFRSSDIECRTVSGIMSGGTGAGAHMWNIVAMDDGMNYLVDITNCDEGSVGYEKELFLVGVPEDDTISSVDNGYTLISNRQSVKYEYDSDTRSVFTDAELTLSKGNYGTHPVTVVYDLNEVGRFKNRTEEEVINRYCDALDAAVTYFDGERSTYYTVMSSTVSPYEPGRLTDDTLLVMHNMTDYYRWLVGVEPLKETCVQSDDLQAGALVRNFDFNHQVSKSKKPADMSDALWDQGANVRHNILAWGYTPEGSICGWMNEGYTTRGGWGTLGHRYALIDSEVSGVQFGYSGVIGIGVDTAYTNPFPEDGFFAFPSPGYMPDDLIYPGESAWSLDFNSDLITVEDQNSIQVNITNTETGSSVVRSTIDDTLRADSSSIRFAQPDPDLSSYSGSYRVEITGLKETASGNPAKIVYTVSFTNAEPAVKTFVTSIETAPGELELCSNMTSDENLKKIAAMLPDEVNVYCRSGLSFTLPVTGKWIANKEDRCFTNSVSAEDLPSNVIDINGVLNEIRISYEIDDQYMIYNFLNLPSDMVIGGSGQVSLRRSVTSANASQVYKIVPNGDGSYSAAVWLDSQTSPEFDAKASEGTLYHYYNVKGASEEWNGEYISIYYVSPLNMNTAYVSSSVKTLTVLSNDISISEVTGVQDKPYTGQAITQDPKVTLHGRVLRKNTDYTLSCTGYNVGMVELIIRGTGLYKGEKRVPFRIQFKDVTDPEEQFYYDHVYWLVDNGITTGYADGTFGSMKECNRAAVVTFLWRLAGRPEPAAMASFKDMTGNSDFDKAISWALEEGITTGWDDNTFRPWNTCNRAAIVTFLWRYAGCPKPAAMASFKDMTGNSDFDQAISWALENGITTGWNDNTFRPWNNCARLAVASFLYRFSHL